MMKQYNPAKIEPKWQAIWQKKGLYQTPRKPGRQKFYSLVMFPYSSGKVHIGHWYNFAPADVYSRFMRMRGKKILQPIGFDAFGLPAEGAAIERDIHPAVWTKKNIKQMTKQLKSMGPSYDWERTVVTCEPDYYRWTQWMFLQMYQQGLAYKKKATANWCSQCKSILANEQAEGGRCWRCETEVEQRQIEQWFLRITDYAEELLRALKDLDWPEKTKIMQKNWIGRSEGVMIKFPIAGLTGCNPVSVFTTRPDTLFGTTFMALAPEYWLTSHLGGGRRDSSCRRQSLWRRTAEVKSYIERARKKTELERIAEREKKTGVFTGTYCINPVNNESVPIWVADYVVPGYGTGAVMGVPAYDERDLAFAKKYKLPVKKVPLENMKEIIEKIVKNGWGRKAVQYHLRDWLVSRQRYWGAPIPMVYCQKCGIVPVPEKDLPVLLPKIDNYLPVEGDSPLARAKEWVKIACPECGGPARRETDTMDTFVCSSWYFLRYADPQNKRQFASQKTLKKWLPVDMYIGGAEHTVLHLLYSRFFVKALRDAGYLDFDEPFLALRHQGIILGEDGYKMSKSRGNVVDPDGLVKKFGADAVRIYLCFMGPYDQGGPWSSKGIVGIYRFLNRVWRLAQDTSEVARQRPRLLRGGEERLLHRTIKKVTEDIEKLKFNTAIARMMEFVNEIQRLGASGQRLVETLLLLLAPFAPHMTEELWQQLKDTSEVAGWTPRRWSIHQQPWPKYDEKLAKEEMVTVVVQVNGKLRDKLVINHRAAGIASLGLRSHFGEGGGDARQSSVIKKEIEKLAKASEKVQKYLKDKKIKKVIFVPGRLINFVTS